MKRFVVLFTALFSQSALAHGLHAPVPEPTHGLAHAAPALGVAALALGALFVYRRRS